MSASNDATREIWYLRIFFLLACVVCVAIATVNASWEGLLKSRDSTLILRLNNAPLWSPPPVPSYDAFEKVFSHGGGVPPRNGTGFTIERSLVIETLLFHLVVGFWLIALFCGAVYRLFRGSQRDLVLHIALPAAIGMALGCASSVGLWFIVGAWGPPLLLQLCFVGLMVGAVHGLKTFSRDDVDLQVAKERWGW